MTALHTCLSHRYSAFFYKVNAKASSGLHTSLVETTFGATFQFLMNEDAGSLLNRFSQDISMATQRAPAMIMPTVFRTSSVFQLKKKPILTNNCN